MVRYVDTMHIDDETFISYCSESDFDYSLRKGQKCKVTFEKQADLTGVIYDIEEESFSLQLDNGKIMIINHKDIEDIFSEEEIGPIR